MSKTPTPPGIITHVGLTVPDIDKALDWYERVLGFRRVAGPTDFQPDETPFGRLAEDVIGDPARFRKGRLALITGGNGVAIEVFQFVEPPTETPANNMEYWKVGWFHICLLDPDLEGLVERVVANGGRQRSKYWEMVPGTDCRQVWVEDPFGNVIEVYSRSSEEIWTAIRLAAPPSGDAEGAT